MLRIIYDGLTQIVGARFQISAGWDKMFQQLDVLINDATGKAFKSPVGRCPSQSVPGCGRLGNVVPLWWLVKLPTFPREFA